MSIVAVKVNKNTITIGCDSQITNYGIYKEDIQKHYGLGKLLRENGLIIGSVGNLCEIAYMRLWMKIAKPIDAREEDILNYMILFYEDCKRKDSTFKPFNSWIIIYKKVVFFIENDLSIYIVDNYKAMGSGMFHAIPLLEMNKSVPESIKMACKLDLYCSEPIKIITLRK